MNTNLEKTIVTETKTDAQEKVTTEEFKISGDVLTVLKQI